MIANRNWLSLSLPCLVLAVAVTAGCNKKQAPPPESAPPVAAAKIDAGPPPVVGMEDPFARLSGDAAKTLKAGHKAMQGKKYDEARADFGVVVAAFPDYSPARFQWVKAAALGGRADDVPELWKALLARDYVAYAGRLDKPKELAMLRGGPEWARIKAVEASVRAAYAADLGKGLLFLARSRDLSVKPAGAGAVKVDLNQELYQYDLASKRYRRLTETEGRVFAYTVAPQRKMISFLLVPTIADAATPTPRFADASVGAIDLATLETIGPLRLGPPGTHASSVEMGWSGQGDPIWIVRTATDTPGTESAMNYALDATRTAVVSIAVAGMTEANRTTATPSSVSTSSTAAAPDQVSLSDDKKSLQIADEDRTLRATRVLDPDTVRFAPGGRRLAYAGAFDECKPTGKADKNELYLWERGKKTATRIATAPSAFRLDWPDDDRLIFQAGLGKQSRIHVLEVATKTDTVLKPHDGAALVGFGAVVCPGATPESDAAEDVDQDTEDGE